MKLGIAGYNPRLTMARCCADQGLGPGSQLGPGVSSLGRDSIETGKRGVLYFRSSSCGSDSGIDELFVLPILLFSLPDSLGQACTAGTASWRGEWRHARTKFYFAACSLFDAPDTPNIY